MGEKKYLIAGGVAMFLMMLCIGFLLLRSTLLNQQQETPKQEQTEETAEPDGMSKEDRDRLNRAEEEVARFKEQYGIDISVTEMVYQLQIRDAYEKMYGRSYDLEDVFIIHNPTGEDASDPPDEEITTEEALQAYIQKYNIDETRFEGMTPEQELEAIRIEYGSLEDDTDSAYYDGLDDADSAVEETEETSSEEEEVANEEE